MAKIIIVKSRAQRIKYFLSKNVSIYIFLSILFIFIYILYKLIGVIQIPNFINYDKSSILYLKVFLLSIYYGNMSLLIILIVNQSIAYVSNMIIYVIVEILSDASNNIIKLVNFIFPIIDKSNKLVLRYDLVIIIFILIFFINNITANHFHTFLAWVNSSKIMILFSIPKSSNMNNNYLYHGSY